MIKEEEKIKVLRLQVEVNELNWRLSRYMNCEVREELLENLREEIRNKEEELNQLGMR